MSYDVNDPQDLQEIENDLENAIEREKRIDPESDVELTGDPFNQTV